MKMSSGMSARIKITALAAFFALATACSGDKKSEGDEMETSGEDAAMSEEGGEAAPAEAAPAPAKKGAKKGGKKGNKKGGAKKGKKKGA